MNRKKKYKNVRILFAIAVLAAVMLTACSGGGQAPQETSAAEDKTQVEVQTEAESQTQFEVQSEAAAVQEEASDSAQQKTGDGFGAFTTVDLEGNEVTESIFGEADYTMINLWGTFCPPCIAEMPDLEELSEQLPENVQIVGLICDLYYEQPDSNVKDEADKIISSAGVKYKNLLLWQDAAELISSLTAFVPTTFFVDSEGNLVGEPIIGADLEAYKERIAELAK